MITPRAVPRGLAASLFAVSFSLVCACASSQAATQQGSFDRAPFYHGKPKSSVTPVGVVEAWYRTEPGSLELTPDRSPALAAVLDSVRAELERIPVLTRLAVDFRQQGRPDVRFGCRRGGTSADGTPRSPTEVDPSEPRRMAFEVEGASRVWRERTQAAAGDSIRSVLSVQLGFGDVWVRQKDWKGNKRIELGSGRSADVAWLTSLDDPVEVLFLTASLSTPDGKVVRVGAEGLIARRTGMLASALGAQEVLTERDIAALGAPAADGMPAWKSALHTLVSRMTAE